MSSFLKKALGVFVEFEQGEEKLRQSTGEELPLKADAGKTITTRTLSGEGTGKFEKHFHALFERANLPGPDYFEFWKMMETLSTHVPDEKARMAVVYATLAVQGLSKEKLVGSAEQYSRIIETDKQEFLNAVNTKLHSEIQGRKQTVIELEKKNAENAELIRKLTEEITGNQNKIKSFRREIGDEESRLNENTNGYKFACDAMMARIGNDIQKIQTNLF